MITKQENPTRKGQELELEIESLAYGGLGLAKLDDFVVFVKGGLPGQTVLGHIYKKIDNIFFKRTLEKNFLLVKIKIKF